MTDFIHWSDQLKAHLRDLQSIPPEDFADLLMSAPPEERAIIMASLEHMQRESTRIIAEIEEEWEARGFDVETLRARRRKRDV